MLQADKGIFFICFDVTCSASLASAISARAAVVDTVSSISCTLRREACAAALSLAASAVSKSFCSAAKCSCSCTVSSLARVASASSSCLSRHRKSWVSLSSVDITASSFENFCSSSFE